MVTYSIFLKFPILSLFDGDTVTTATVAGVRLLGYWVLGCQTTVLGCWGHIVVAAHGSDGQLEAALALLLESDLSGMHARRSLGGMQRFCRFQILKLHYLNYWCAAQA